MKPDYYVTCPTCKQQARILALCDCDACVTRPPNVYKPTCMGCHQTHYKRKMK
jgi:hypothetical protein